VSRDPEAASKLVNELYSTNIKNSYSVFRLGEERFMVIPNNVQVEDILL
jgi:GGDEF domain-containing protein